MELRPENMTETQRAVLLAKLAQSNESGQVSLLTAAVLAVLMWIVLRLGHLMHPWLILVVPMLGSGVAGYLICRRRSQALKRDLRDEVVLSGAGRAELVRLEDGAESYVIQLGDRKLQALSSMASLRSMVIRPDARTFAGQVAFAPRSGQLLSISDYTGQSLFDAYEESIRRAS